MLKPAKIESNLSKFPDCSTQIIDQVNLQRENNLSKMTIVAITVKIFLMNWCLKEWFWISSTLMHQNIEK